MGGGGRREVTTSVMMGFLVLIFPVSFSSANEV